MTNRTIDTLVTVTSGTEIDITLQDAIEINIDTPMLYIQSGKEDINYFVEQEAKPKLEDYINTEAKPLVSTIIENIAEPTVIEYVENIIKPYITEYSEIKKNELQESVSTSIEIASSSASIATEQATLAQERATNALTSKNSAEQFAISASSSAVSAYDSATLAENAVNTLSNYIGEIETKTNESLVSINEATSKTQTQLNSKANTDFSNVIANIDYVIETYKSGNSWYRKYKSGWIEQGGQATGVNAKTGLVLNLLKSFSNTNYNFQSVTYAKDNTATAHVQSAKILAKTASNITILTTQQSATNAGYYNLSFDWYACGQGA